MKIMDEVVIKLDRQVASDALEVIALCKSEDKARDFMNGHSVDVLDELVRAIRMALR